MGIEEVRSMWETRSEAGQFLQWLINEKGVLPTLDVSGLASEYARTKREAKRQRLEAKASEITQDIKEALIKRINEGTTK